MNGIAYSLPPNLHKHVADCIPQITAETIMTRSSADSDHMPKNKKTRIEIYDSFYQVILEGRFELTTTARNTIITLLKNLHSLVMHQAESPVHIKTLCGGGATDKAKSTLTWRSQDNTVTWSTVTTKEEYDLAMAMCGCSFLSVAIRMSHEKNYSNTIMKKCLDNAAVIFRYRMMSADAPFQSEFSPMSLWYNRYAICAFMYEVTLAVEQILKLNTASILTTPHIRQCVDATSKAVYHLEKALTYFMEDGFPAIGGECLSEINKIAKIELDNMRILLVVFTKCNLLLNATPPLNTDDEWEAGKQIYKMYHSCRGNDKKKLQQIITECVSFVKGKREFKSYAGYWPVLMLDNIYDTVTSLPSAFRPTVSRSVVEPINKSYASNSLSYHASRKEPPESYMTDEMCMIWIRKLFQSS